MSEPVAAPAAPADRRPPRKLPLLEPVSAFFWTSGEDGQLRIQRCDRCGRYQHPPWPRCTRCGSEGVAPQVVSGRGRVATWSANVEPWLPGLQVPYLFGAVELDEQPDLYVFTNFLMPPGSVTRHSRVQVTFERHDDVWLPMFVADDDADGTQATDV